MNQPSYVVSVKTGDGKLLFLYHAHSVHPAVDVDAVLQRVARESRGDPAKAKQLLESEAYPSRFEHHNAHDAVFIPMENRFHGSNTTAHVSLICDRTTTRLRKETLPKS